MEIYLVLYGGVVECAFSTVGEANSHIYVERHSKHSEKDSVLYDIQITYLSS